MNKSALAYCAGIVDADGTIGIKKNSYAMRVVKDCGQATYSERVCVKQVERHAVDFLAEMFGGYRYTSRPTAARGRALETWQVTDLKAAAFLKAVRPFLRIKRRQAENCLLLRQVKNASKKARVARKRGHVGSARRSQLHSAEMERLCLIAHDLNRVGV